MSTITFGEPVPGRVHVLVAFDLLSSVTPANVEGLDAAWSHVVANTTITPTGRMIGNVSTSALDLAPYRDELARARSARTTGGAMPAASRSVCWVRASVPTCCSWAWPSRPA